METTYTFLAHLCFVLSCVALYFIIRNVRGRQMRSAVNWLVFLLACLCVGFYSCFYLLKGTL